MKNFDFSQIFENNRFCFRKFRKKNRVYINFRNQKSLLVQILEKLNFSTIECFSTIWNDFDEFFYRKFD